MSLLSWFADAKLGARATKYATRAASIGKYISEHGDDVVRSAGKSIPLRDAPAARKAAERAAVYSTRAARLRTRAQTVTAVDGVVRDVAAPARAVARIAGGTAIGAGRLAGVAANSVARHPARLGYTVAGIGVVAGVTSGLRDSARTVNSALGNPVGAYSSMAVRTAFSGQSQSGRTPRANASGNIVINSTRRR